MFLSSTELGNKASRMKNDWAEFISLPNHFPGFLFITRKYRGLDCYLGIVITLIRIKQIPAASSTRGWDFLHKIFQSPGLRPRLSGFDLPGSELRDQFSTQ
jgi:hypothetical protein